jgi:hypothetical protein
MNKQKGKLAMVEPSSMKQINEFDLDGDMQCCIVTNDDQYIIVCTSEEV